MNRKLLQNTTVIFFSIVNAVLAFVLVDSIPTIVSLPNFEGFVFDSQFILLSVFIPAVLPTIVFVIKATSRDYYIRLLVWSYIFMVILMVWFGLSLSYGAH